MAKINISYNQLFNNFPSTKIIEKSVDVYKSIGYTAEEYNALISRDNAYKNTCAVRMSIALIKSGVVITGREGMKIKIGDHKGRLFEPGAIRLADDLKNKISNFEYFKPPTTFKLNGRKGIVFYKKIQGYGGGHIDLISPYTPYTLSDPSLGLITIASNEPVCASQCYPICEEIWFWELLD